jgi:hypothetical protein
VQVDGWDQIPRWAGGWACTSHPGVLGSIPKREEPGKTGRHPVLKVCVCVCLLLQYLNQSCARGGRRYRHRAPHGSHAHSFVLGTAVINNNKPATVGGSLAAVGGRRPEDAHGRSRTGERSPGGKKKGVV